jgi:hypothetical protein
VTANANAISTSIVSVSVNASVSATASARALQELIGPAAAAPKAAAAALDRPAPALWMDESARWLLGPPPRESPIGR